MKSEGSSEQRYNAQIAVEEGSQWVVATGLTQSAGDNPELMALIERAAANTGKPPERVLAEAG